MIFTYKLHTCTTVVIYYVHYKTHTRIEIGLDEKLVYKSFILLVVQKIFPSYTSMDCFACTPLWRLLQMAFSPPSYSQEDHLLSCSPVRKSIHLERMQRSTTMTSASPMTGIQDFGKGGGELKLTARDYTT